STIACPSSVNDVNDGSPSSVSSTPSTTAPSRSRNCSKGRYHSRSQCVCGTTRNRKSLTEATVTIERMRFETVLFDLDGTVVDSGAIILASMRHATREVLGRDYSDEELLQAVGGPGLEAQMSALAPDHVERLVDVYRAHNEPLHDELEACAGMEDVLVRLREEGRRLGIVTAKRRSTVELGFARVPIAHLFE